MIDVSRECGEASIEGCAQSSIADAEIGDEKAAAIVSTGAERVAELASCRAIVAAVVVEAATGLVAEESLKEASTEVAAEELITGAAAEGFATEVVAKRSTIESAEVVVVEGLITEVAVEGSIIEVAGVSAGGAEI